MEALVAMAIAVLAVVGLAYSFGVGRGWINRFEVARVADARAQSRLDSLLSLPNTDPANVLGTHAGPPFSYKGQALGTESWRIETVANAVPGHSVLRRATATVSWRLATITDSLSYQALFPAP